MARKNSSQWTGHTALWTTWAPSVGVLVLVGAHLTAAVLGLYSSAPNVTVLHPLTGSSHDGQVEISAQADDGPTGSGVRSVEFQVDSTNGAWRPLVLDPLTTSTYRGRWDASRVARGEHALYLRATDYTGNLRTVHVQVMVNPSTQPDVMPTVPVSQDRAAALSQRILGGLARGEAPRATER